MKVENKERKIIISAAQLRVVVDGDQGGNITLASFLPLDLPVLTTNYHSTDVYVGIEGIGGFYTTGDAEAEINVVKTGESQVVIEADSVLARVPSNPPDPQRAGRVLRRYTVWDDLPVIRIDTEIGVDPKLVGRNWCSRDARLVDLEANYDELDRFAFTGPKGELIRGELSAAHNGGTWALGEPCYSLYGDRVGLTVRLDDAEKYCYYWAENALINMGDLNIRGVSFLVQWSYGRRAVVPKDMPLIGTFWIGFHGRQGPLDFEWR